MTKFSASADPERSGQHLIHDMINPWSALFENLLPLTELTETAERNLY
jgi:hypothetical protein